MENHSEKLANWLKDATLINRSALCKQVGIDRGNLDKFLQRGSIPEKYIEPLAKALCDYGYKEILDELISENNKPDKKEKILKERNEATKKEFKQPLLPENSTDEPIRKAGESGIDFKVRHNEWWEKQKNTSK